MGKAGGGLTVRAVAAAKHPGAPARPIRIGDGGGLYLQIAPAGSKSWLFRFTLVGKAREMGLGPVGEPPKGVTLAAARLAAAEASGLLRQGLDPIYHRAAALRRGEADRAKAAANTFRSVAEEMVSAREAGWRNAKHRQQWRNTLAAYAYPVIGDLPVSEVGTEDVLRVLRPIWTAKPETASRLRGRIERVLAYAKAMKLRGGENPAVWRGHLSEALASPRRIEGKAPGHHAALPWQEAPLFVAELRGRDAVAARALEFAILTAARTSEVLGARWREVDLDGAVWTVPAGRMKAQREHRVPLSGAALAVLRAVLPLASGPEGFVFPGQRRGSGLSQMALLMLLRRMNPEGEGGPARWRDARTGEPVTAHGFRSTFRDWCGEASRHPTDLAEAALAHITKDKTEAAYARGDLFAKRAVLMADWAAFYGQPAADVVSMQASQRARAR
jgi:integrase